MFLACDLQADPAAHGGSHGLQPFMHFGRSVDDGALPLLECFTSADVHSGDRIVPGTRGPLIGWPTKRPLQMNSASKAGQEVLWEVSEKAVGLHYKD